MATLRKPFSFFDNPKNLDLNYKEVEGNRTMAALYKCPDMVFAAMAKDRAELLRKGQRND